MVAPTRSHHVVIAGAGAAGTLVALQLVRGATKRSAELAITLIDPADRWGRGVAYGTSDVQHLLNVPASGMSALAEDPSHFMRWRRSQGAWDADDGYAFASRRSFARYLDDTLSDALAKVPTGLTLEHTRAQVTGVARNVTRLSVTTDHGATLDADALVVATGLPPTGTEWAPEALRSSGFFVPDPWAPGALDVVRRDRCAPGAVLLVGAGLTMVDVALSLTAPGTRADRSLQVVSRTGRLPKRHAPAPALAAVPEIADWRRSLVEVRAEVVAHLESVRRATGDWRPGLDGLRVHTAALWERLSEEDRLDFLDHDAGTWNVMRHRIPSSTAAAVDVLRRDGRLSVTRGTVVDADPLPFGGLGVTLSDGAKCDVGWVVNCTGPQADVRRLANPLLDDLLRSREGGAFALPATAGMGFRTRDGRILDESGSLGPLWTLGALRRGEMWESTAIPEIRSQAAAVAVAVLDELVPVPRRLADGTLVHGHHPRARPRDPLGLPISTTADAAAAYNIGLERLMRLETGAEDALREAAELDPGFALAHATLALLGHEAGATTDVRASLQAARRAVAARGDDRERSLVDVVGQRVKDARRSGARALVSHIDAHPRDVVALSAAVPTIAFSGVTDVQQEAWDLVEGVASAYGDHWWYISLLAFTRQDQGRYDEAGLLAESALACEPSSGHAVHAQAHVLYETGQHEQGRAWLDHWISESGRSASHRAHFAWHVALHDLAMGDTEGLRGRYYSQLAPPAVTGVRALVDSASLLWRWHVTTVGWPDSTELPAPPVDPVLAAVDPALLQRPQTPFMALHAALAHAAAGDVAALTRLGRHSASSRESTMRAVLPPLCVGMVAAVEQRWREAADALASVMPQLVRLGGSAAQREVVEETLLLCLTEAGDVERAGEMLDRRLDRRRSLLDRRRRDDLHRATQGPEAATRRRITRVSS